MTLRLLTIGLSLSVLAGCATTPGSCDSSDHNSSLITKMNCDYSGGYSEQVRQREQGLSDARAENELFHRVYQEIAAQQATTQQSLLGQEQQREALERSLGMLLNQLKSRHANKSQVQEQIAGLEQQLNGPAGAGQTADAEARKQELKALQQKVSRLQLSLGYE